MRHAKPPALYRATLPEAHAGGITCNCIMPFFWHVINVNIVSTLFLSRPLGHFKDNRRLLLIPKRLGFGDRLEVAHWIVFYQDLVV
jgi:hypothetical protein